MNIRTGPRIFYSYMQVLAGIPDQNGTRIWGNLNMGLLHSLADKNNTPCDFERHTMPKERNECEDMDLDISCWNILLWADSLHCADNQLKKQDAKWASTNWRDI